MGGVDGGKLGKREGSRASVPFPPVAVDDNPTRSGQTLHPQFQTPIAKEKKLTYLLRSVLDMAEKPKFRIVHMYDA